MIHRSTLHCAAALGVLSLSLQTWTVSRQSASPTTQPEAPAATTMPASAPVVPTDSSSPRGALKVLFTAMQKGDDVTLRKAILASTTAEQRVVDAMARRAQIETRFRNAAVKSFGPENAKALVGDTDSASTDAMTKIDRSTETITGDSAAVDNGAGAPPLMLTKVSNEWKVPAAEFSKGIDPSEIDQQLDNMGFAAELINQFVGEMEAGKYKTAEEAGDALKQRMYIEMMKRSSTRPTVPPPGVTPPAATPPGTTSPPPADPATPATPGEPVAPPTTQPR